MRKICVTVISILLSCFLFGCGNNATTETSSDKETSAEALQEESGASSRDCFEWGSYDELKLDDSEKTKITGLTEKGLNQEELVIPDYVVSVRDLTSENLKSVTFLGADTTLETDTFMDCTALESAALPENLEEIPDALFFKCSSLLTVEIPDSVKAVGDDAFWGCESLEEVNLGPDVENVGGNAFYKCNSLTSVTLPDSVATLEKGAFEECASLESVEFSSGLVVIGDEAFLNCVSLKSVTLPESLESIGYEAFAFCDSLEEIYLPESLLEMDASALSQTHTTKVYVYEGSYADERLSEITSNYLEKQYRQ